MSSESGPQGGETRTVGEHVRTETEKRESWRQKALIREAIRQIHSSLYRGRYGDAAELLATRVVEPMGLTTGNLPKLRDELEDDGLAYHYFETHHFLENSAAYCTFFRSSPSTTSTKTVAKAKLAGRETAVATARKRLRSAFLTIENIAISAGVLRDELSNASTLKGWGGDIGVVWKSFERNLPEEINLWGIDDDEEVSATAIQGAPGNGKSMSVEKLLEDRYLANAFRPWKCIDLIDFKEVENAFYDQQRDDDLLDVLEDHGQPQWYDEIDGVDEPTVEILIPLTPELCRWKVPFDLEDDRFVVRPFTIPTSDVPKRALRAMMTRTTNVQGSTLEKAFKRVRSIDDWNLADLARAVKDSTDDERLQDNILTNLESLQRSGFLRDRSDKFAIDWNRIFRSTDTITCFSVAGLRDRSEKLMSYLYLSSSIRTERETTTDEIAESTGYPRLTVGCREFRLLVPPESKKTKDPVERKLEGALIDEWVDLMAFHRHDDVEILADSQQFTKQVHSDARANFGRGITYRNKKPYARDFWKEYGADYEGSYVRRVATQFSPGDFAYLGESSVDERTFHSPCYMYPPMSGHYDSQEDDHGFLKRVKLSDSEELRPAPWSSELPDRFALDAASTSDGPPTAAENPVGFFFHRCMRQDDEYFVFKEEFRKVYREFARQESEDGLDPELSKSSIGTKLRDHLGDELEQGEKQVNGRRGYAYVGVAFAPRGVEILSNLDLRGNIPKNR